MLIGLASGLHLSAADYPTALEAYRSGDYVHALTEADEALQSNRANERWHELRIESLLMTGQYPEARRTATNAVTEYPSSLPLRWLTRETLLMVGETKLAASEADEVVARILSRPRRYRDPRSLVAAGRAFLLRGFDPKQVMDKLYAQAKEADPTLRDAYLAGGELALEKSDYALAAEWYREGLTQLPDDADLQFGLARAYARSEPGLAMRALEAALERNSNHAGCLLLLADRKIDEELYEDASSLLDAVLAVNPSHPDAWAHRAVIAHLQNDSVAEQKARDNALEFWPDNPRVDYLIGRKLSQKYRFREGANRQMQALQFDGGYQPAMLQLAQDLLRLGHESDGWRLAERVHQMDQYDITANNLVALHEVLQEFHTLSNDHFHLRMDPHEALVYGNQALDLLEEARLDLGAKYGLPAGRPVSVDVFHRQSDFAVRTFGMPENHGYLGVCFGSVITANSPASRPGRPFNWKSMLWHEYCHVVTLQLTGNKIPRWLSEGISVYEERLADPTWGEQLTPAYRDMLLSEDLIPVSELSSSFLNPDSSVHLQFAYYQSSLVVELLVTRYGQDTMVALLRELSQGTPINDALERHVAPMAELEAAFTEFAHETARAFGPELDWEQPHLDLLMSSEERPDDEPTTNRWTDVGPMLRSEGWEDWAAEHPTNFWVMTRKADELIREEQWEKALPILEELVRKAPEVVGTPSAYTRLAEVHRALGDTDAERRVLTDFVLRDDEAPDAFMRLIELVTPEGDWSSVIENARRYLAVNPLVAPPYRHLAEASEAAGQTTQAIDACRVLLELDPPNPAQLHYRLARLLHSNGDAAARQHVLQALEEAPRYRDALELLLEINSPAKPDDGSDNNSET